MIATLLRLSLLALYGVPMARAFDRRLSGSALAGTAFLLGSGAVALEMFALSVIHVPWTRTALGAAALPLAAWTSWIVLKREGWSFRRSAHAPDRRPHARAVGWLTDIAILIPIGAHALFATRRGLYEWDFFGIWGLKARTFFEVRGIDWQFVQTNISHPDYPLLVPLVFDFHALASGGWQEQTLGLVLTAYGAALVAVARGALREEFDSEWVAAAGTFAVVFPALTLWIGLAEGIVMAYGCAGLILIRRGITERKGIAGVPPASPPGILPGGDAADLQDSAGRADRAHSVESIHLGAILLGLAAWSKNEGLALLGVALLSLLLCRRWRDALRLWPGFATIAPWLVVRAYLHLQTDFVDAGITARMIARVRDFRTTAAAFLKSPPDQPLFWIVTLACMAIYFRKVIEHERFLTLAVALQMALFLVQGMATRADLKAHVSLTMNRIPQQIAPACAFLAVVLVLPEVASAVRMQRRSAGVSPAAAGRPPAAGC